MPFQKGHKPMGGRRTLTAELADYGELNRKWKDPKYAKEVLKRIKANKESLEDIFFGMSQKESKVAVEIFKKLYPDQHKLMGDKENPLTVQITGMRITKENGD